MSLSMKMLTVICCCFITFTAVAQPIADIGRGDQLARKSVLAYPPIQDRDIMWKKYVWRVIDVREKMNLPFVYPNAPFFNIVTEAARRGRLEPVQRRGRTIFL